MYMVIFLACLFVHHICSACGSQKMTSEPLQLESQLVVSICVCWDSNQVLWESSIVWGPEWLLTVPTIRVFVVTALSPLVVW